MTLPPGATLGRFQILEPLGQGGMATVYKAYQPSLEREVALKVLRPGFAQDAQFLERFEREAKSIGRLRHPHIVQVFDFDTSGGQYVLAMEFLEGGTLATRLDLLRAEGRRLEPEEAVRIIGEVAGALGYAHQQGVVHRDIKPSNVMLTRQDWAVVTDFGIARILDTTSHTQTGVGIGTPEYMSPEQGQGQEVDHRADIYSLGVLAYELLVGRVPFHADTPLAVIYMHVHDPLPLPSSANAAVGPQVERVLLKALAKDREQRFASAPDLGEALRAALDADSAGGLLPTMTIRKGGQPAPARHSQAAAGAAPGARPLLTSRPLVLGAAGALLIAAIAGAALVSGVRPLATPTTAPSTAPTAIATVGGAAPTAAASASATPGSDPGIPRGALIYEAKLER
ncbi:MAG TPA: serine/threonine-protein kinase, partial [Candidatus Limnocylindria bacterium]|nr:serine/threonine-protein kinase [Candidatus Limnocylindria bacterium]